MVQKISIGFTKYTDVNFEKKAQSILLSMTDNTNFPSPIPTLAELQAALDAYTAALVAAEQKSTVSIVNKNAIRKELESILRQLGLFIMYNANQNVAVLASSGYDLTKIPQPQNLENPGLVTMADGISVGQMTVSIKKPKGARSFFHELTADPITPDSVWLRKPGTTAKYTFENLQSGSKMWARVGVVGSRNEIAYSDLNSRFVQ